MMNKQVLKIALLLLTTFSLNIVQFSISSFNNFSENCFQIEILEIEKENFEEEKIKVLIDLDVPKHSLIFVFNDINEESFTLFHPEIISPPPEILKA